MYLVCRVVKYVFYLTEINHSGAIPTGAVLFTSETNNVDVRFTSDNSVTRIGFTLDIRSTLCSEIVTPDEEEEENSSENCEDRPAQELVIGAGEVLQGALVTDTGNDFNYPNNACQKWNIMADENQVYLVFQNKGFFHIYIV